MNDLSASGLPVSQPSQLGGRRDKVGNGKDQGDDAREFGDLMQAAGKKADQEETAFADAPESDADQDPKPIVTRIVDVAAKVTITRANEHALAAQLALAPATEADAEAEAATGTATEQLVADTGIDTAPDDTLPEPALANPAETAETGDPSLNHGRLALDIPQFRGNALEGHLAARKPDASTNANGASDKKQLDAGGSRIHPAKQQATETPAQQLSALLGLAAAEGEAEVDADAELAIPANEKNASAEGDLDNPVDLSPDAPVADFAVPMVKAGTGDAQHANLQQSAMQQSAAQQSAVPQSAIQQSVDVEVDEARGARQPVVDAIRLVSSDVATGVNDSEFPTQQSDEGAPTVGSKTDFIAVLDSRRYLGFSSDSNAAALTNAVKGDTSWAQVIHNVNTGNHQTATVVNTLKLQMNPEHLGNMTASLRLKGEELSVEIRVETVDAFRQLSGDQDGIVRALKEQGFAIDQVSIQLSPAAKADAGQGNNNQNSGNQQGGNGQDLKEGQGENARQREEDARRNANQSNWIGNDRTLSTSDTGNGSDNSGSRNLYL